MKQKAGMTFLELMLVVAVVAILAMVAIPQYMNSVRQSYLNEVNSAIAAIKNAEEGYFSNNQCYVDAQQWPAGIPRGGVPKAWDPAPGAWASCALAVRPDRLVRFQYQVYASNSWGPGCGGNNAKTYVGADYGTAGALGCVSNITSLIPDSVFPTNWYVIVARGNLASGAMTSNIVSAIDDTSIISCNALY